ncbi:MAG: MaoC/PaaZ C-terminal domain-containing protein [Haloechinothrix sp.]
MADVELDSAPNLASLFPKAVVSGLLPGKKRGKDLPDTALVRRDVVVDPEHLVAYNEVCGFRLTDKLPSTYLHILVFPLQVKLMAEPSFPFPLVGLVHVSNTITQHRPVTLTESFSLRVRVENLRPHEKGNQFDVISEVIPAGEDAPVWTDVSTYLRRLQKQRREAPPQRVGASSSGGGKKEQLAAPTPKAIWHIPGDIGRRYAEVSGDHNPIHLYAATAKLLGFPKAIAHGMWTKAHSLAAFEGKLPDAYTLDVRFKLPVLLPAKAAFTTWSTEDGFAFELWDARKPKPYLEGTITRL